MQRWRFVRYVGAIRKSRKEGAAVEGMALNSSYTTYFTIRWQLNTALHTGCEHFHTDIKWIHRSAAAEVSAEPWSDIYLQVLQSEEWDGFEFIVTLNYQSARPSRSSWDAMFQKASGTDVHAVIQLYPAQRHINVEPLRHWPDSRYVPGPCWLPEQFNIMCSGQFWNHEHLSDFMLSALHIALYNMTPHEVVDYLCRPVSQRSACCSRPLFGIEEITIHSPKLELWLFPSKVSVEWIISLSSAAEAAFISKCP